MISSNIVSLMEKSGKSIRGLARETGLATLTVTRARGARIVECRLSTLEVIAGALGCSTKDLYEETAYAWVEPGGEFAEAAEATARPYGDASRRAADGAAPGPERPRSPPRG